MNEVDLNNAAFCRRKGVRKKYQNLENDVWKWVQSQNREHNKIPCRKMVEKYAREKYHLAGFTDFKASHGWYRRWEKRYKLKGNISGASTSTSTNQTQINDILSYPVDKSGNELQRSNYLLSTHTEYYSDTLESFSLETDKLISDIGMINSPSEFFDFGDNFEKSIDAIDNNQSSISIDSSDVSMEKFMKELMDDFGKYFNESETPKVVRINKRSCKYDQDFKDEVISFVTEVRIKEAAAKFNIHVDTISIWLKEREFQKQLSEIILQEVMNKKNGNSVQDKADQFIAWLQEKDKNGIVSKTVLQEKIMLLFDPCWSKESHWFAKYCFRYLQGKQEKLSRINYPSQFQSIIMNHAEKTSQSKTASVFNLARKQLFNWTKGIHAVEKKGKKLAEDELSKWYTSKILKPSSREVRMKAKEIYNELGKPKCSYSWYYKWCSKNNIVVKRTCDEALIGWILAAYDENRSLSHADVQNKALEIYQTQNEGSFQASTGWLLRFCRRYMNILRRTPPLSSPLPTSCETNIVETRKKLRNIFKTCNIPAECCGVMDEILLKLKPSASTNKNEKRKPLLRSCGTDILQGTVILSCLSNGNMLPPVLVLKDKLVHVDFNDILVLHQPNGTVDEAIVKQWLDAIWFKNVPYPNMLILDCYPPHSNHELKEKFVEKNSHLIIIPPGCSSKLNPLTQIIAPQFQKSIDDCCRRWFKENSLTWQIGGCGPPLSSKDIVKWVSTSFEKINVSTMQESVREVFEVMGLTYKKNHTMKSRTEVHSNDC